MKENAAEAAYYVLDKANGVTSAPIKWKALEEGLASQQWQADTPVTQEGAEHWCSLAELLNAGQGARVADVIGAKSSSNMLTRIIGKLFNKKP